MAGLGEVPIGEIRPQCQQNADIELRGGRPEEARLAGECMEGESARYPLKRAEDQRPSSGYRIRAVKV